MAEVFNALYPIIVISAISLTVAVITQMEKLMELSLLILVSSTSLGLVIGLLKFMIDMCVQKVG